MKQPQNLDKMKPLNSFTNLIDLLTYFADEKKCKEYLENIRWDGKLECPHEDCGHDKIFRCKDRYKCAKCKRLYSVKVGTIFENSNISLQRWFACIYLITAHKKGISSLQLSRDLSVTQKTSWFMLHRVRHALARNRGTEKLKGIIECDETFMGGAEKNKHKNKRTENTQGRSVATKSAVAGVMERKGEVRADVVPDTSGYNLRPYVVKNVEFGADIMTDEHLGYNGLEQLFHRYKVNHGEGEYVKGSVHTNSLEGFWSWLKRGIDGTYHSISKKHLQQYLDEFSFRYNTRTCSGNGRFNIMLNNINSRLTYKQLTHGDKGNNPKVEAEQKSLGF